MHDPDTPDAYVWRGFRDLMIFIAAVAAFKFIFM